MDPMDFTMDDSSNVLAGNAQHRYPYQCQQPQALPHPHTNGPSFVSQPPSQTRDTQHYDPVHDSSPWYQHGNSNGVASRPPYPAPQNISQWGPTPHTTDSGHSWSQATDMDRPARQDYTAPDYRRNIMPWGGGESRGFDAFNHPAYNPPPVNAGSNMSTEAAFQDRTQAALRGFALDQHQRFLSFHRGANISPQYTPTPSNTAAVEPRPPQNHGATPSAETSIPQQPPGLQPPGLRSGFSRATRPNSSRHEDILEGSRRRRLAASWDSDDDEESLVEIERMEVARRHAAEALFGSEFDDERSIAALRGAVAGGKRVPSKEALDSLEPVKVADLTDADKTCIICYNEFGVSNPEGDIENPIRLPKCKHVFGDKCIKKWFEDSDSCPYCRDKLPSELAARKSLGAYQSYRLAHREQMRLTALAQRSRYSAYAAGTGVPSIPDDPHANSPATAQRAQEDYELVMARQADWSYSSSNQNRNGDSPERRRQARGRHGAIRGPHFLGRPTSVGSTNPTRALSNPSFSHQPARNYADYYSFVPQRRNAYAAEASGREAATTAARERERLAAQTQTSAGSSFRTTWSPSSSSSSSPENLGMPGSASRTPPERPPPVLSAPTEEASPPIAVGSGVSARRQAAQQNSVASRLSLESDNSDFMFEPSSDARSRQSPEETNNTESRTERRIEPSSSIPSFGSLREGSNNSAIRFGSASSNDSEDLVRIGRMDASIPPGWGSIN